MAEHIDPDFLAHMQYADAGGLSKRIEIQEHYSSNPESWFQWLFDRIYPQRQSRILELGCGPGDLWIENLDRLPDGLEVILSDLSPGMLHEAQVRLPGDIGCFYFVVVDAQAIPFESEGLDIVIGNGLIDHIPDRVKALDEIHRVLKPEGLLITTAGGRSHLQEIESLVKPFVPEADFGGDPARFGLENGALLLSPWFCEIQQHVFTDQLVFDEPDPIITYVLSESSVQRALVGGELERFRSFVTQTLDGQGNLEVTTEKGLFCGRKVTRDKVPQKSHK
jgi:SAM-dependent methyltransferase